MILAPARAPPAIAPTATAIDRKSTRLNSSHRCISYAVFCLKKKVARTVTTPNRSHGLVFAPEFKRGFTAGRSGSLLIFDPKTLQVIGEFIPSFFFNDTATTEIYTLTLHDALPI